MQIQLLYFAAIRDLVRTPREYLELPDAGADLALLLERLLIRHPTLAGRLEGVRLARNEAFAELDEVLEDGDVVAVIPPVSGG